MKWQTGNPPKRDWYRIERRCRNCGESVLMFLDYIGEDIFRSGFLEPPCDCFEQHHDGNDEWRLYDE